jgi:hypothetical protein
LVELVKYNSTQKQTWDEFISKSRNGTFLFYREYMDYHSDRFNDHSLMFYENNALIAVLPGNIENDSFISRGGLTYGGVVIDSRIGTIKMLRIFDVLLQYMRSERIKRIIYKAVPHIYHYIPSEEDVYALFINNAHLIKREVSSAVFIPHAHYPGNRNRGASKAVKEGVIIKESNDLETFMKIVNSRLSENYALKAVHSPEEMELLVSRFPQNIKLFAADYKGDIVAGGIVYLCNKTLHLQYSSTNECGRRLRALDLLIKHLIFEVYQNLLWFDFGISTEKGGRFLNEGLIKQKEEFGASAINYDTYLLEI